MRTLLQKSPLARNESADGMAEAEMFTIAYFVCRGDLSLSFSVLYSLDAAALVGNG